MGKLGDVYLGDETSEGCNEYGAYEMGADQVPFLDQGGYKSVHFIIIHSSKHLFCLVFWIFNLFYHKDLLQKKGKEMHTFETPFFSIQYILPFRWI